MPVQLHSYAFISILSALISFAASVTIWRRSAPGSSALSVLLLSMTIWAGCYATRWMDVTAEAKIFWFRMMFIGVASIPTLFLLFALSFTHNGSWLTSRHLILLSIQPVTSLLLQWTNQYHHFIYQSVNIIEKNGLVMIELTRGPWYFVNIVYSYTVITIGFLLMSRGALRLGPLYRYQYRLILVASILPWAANIFNEVSFGGTKHLDLAPFTFGLSGIIYVFAILRTRFMDLIPVARSHLIENMRDGVMVLDAQNRVVDINPAMELFLEKQPAYYLGQNAFEVFDGWLQKTDLLWDEVETRAELKVPKNPPRYLDLRVTPLYDREQLLNGRLMVFRDMTERKQDEKRLRYVNERLQAQLIEIGLLQSKLREQAIRDPLTDLFNRRYLEETLDRELARAGREAYPVCIIMVDLDHFKQTNDTYGHDAGDQVLRALANTLAEQSRRGDFACRYGGEEFVIVMPNISERTASERARKLRRRLKSLQIPYECHNLTTTISMGIACYPTNGETRQALLRAADKAMYAAKKAGRDYILTYDQLLKSEEKAEN
ncbi:MAG TPA: histidine kinase N-terminal 7TM domain-containing protein [Anaerolineales bacterium]|nr:histidine kinase N-terminal 7TM domain-containing protein [Anaerolineales bacterium]